MRDFCNINEIDFIPNSYYISNVYDQKIEFSPINNTQLECTLNDKVKEDDNSTTDIQENVINGDDDNKLPPVLLSLSNTNHNKNNDHFEKCSYKNCTKVFRNKTSLRKHFRTHGPKRYKCNDCGKLFLENSKLKRHKLVHTGEQPYSCQYCNKKFALSYNLKTHLRIHTGDKPFVCNYEGCSKKFSQSTNLKYHLLAHENIKSGRLSRRKKFHKNEENNQNTIIF